MSTRTIVFDLDGTFADTADDIIDSLNHCLAGEGMAPADTSDIAKYVGHGGRVMIERAFTAQNRSLPTSLHDRLVGEFLDYYRANIPGRTQPYAGAVECVRKFRAADYRSAICTNKFESLSVALIEALGYGGLFDSICGSDTFPYRKPDPRHLTDTIRMAGGDPALAIMVGDSKTDIDTAKAAAIPVVAVDFGYSPEPVADLGPDHVISRFDELTPDLAYSLIKQSKAAK